jgi:diguanylate cyclase (GGDEF)-like protein
MNKRLNNTTVKYEVTFILLINIIFFFIFSQIDLLEILYDYSKEHESYELDEIIPLFITISVSLLVFSLRRLYEVKRLSSKLYTMANYDDMTKVHNRRYMNDILETECERVKRSGTVFSLILLDIDDFKKVNDDYGHQTGDKVLIRFAQMLQDSTRKLDVLCRWGGEEFMILCRDTDQEGAQIIAQKLMDKMQSFKCDLVEGVTASLGVVSTDKDLSTDALFNRVDNALYEAKSQGKNQYVIG